MDDTEEWSCWRHTWRGTCSRSIRGYGWNRFTTMWEEITQDEYEDWVWNRKKLWLWDKKTAREELGLELL